MTLGTLPLVYFHPMNLRVSVEVRHRHGLAPASVVCSLVTVDDEVRSLGRFHEDDVSFAPLCTQHLLVARSDCACARERGTGTHSRGWHGVIVFSITRIRGG